MYHYGTFYNGSFQVIILEEIEAKMSIIREKMELLIRMKNVQVLITFSP